MYEQDQEGDQDFYKRLSLTASRGIWSNYQTKQREYSTGYYQRNKLKNPNDNSFKNQRNQFIPMTPKQPRIRNARQNQVITNLKSQLQNIKSEVAKLIKKQDDERVSDVGSVRTPKNIKTPNQYDNFQDNSSSSSFALRRQNRTRLSTQQNNKQKYLQLQTQSLRNELKNLKTKYIMRKSQHKQQTQTLKKKIHLLQTVISESQYQMSQYKLDIQKQIQTIRNNMSTKSQTPQLQKQCQQLNYQITYLKKRVIQANQQIKAMAIENDFLTNQSKTNNIDQIQNLKLQFYSIITQKDKLLQQKHNQILKITSKQSILQQTVHKNKQLVQTLNQQRQKYQLIINNLNQKINEQLLIIQYQKEQNNKEQEDVRYQELLNKYNDVINELEKSRAEKQNMNRDLSELGGLMTEMKIKNLELEENRNKSESDGQYKKRCEELENQLNEFKGNVMEMVRETAQKINYLEQQNESLKRGQGNNNLQELLSEVEFLKNQNQRILTLIAEQKFKVESKMDQCVRLQKVIQDLQQKLQISTTSSHSQNKHDNTQQKIAYFQQQLLCKQQQILCLKSDNSTFSSLFSSKCQQLQSINLSYQSQFFQSQSKQSILLQSIKTLQTKLKQYQQVYTKTLRQTKQLLTNNLIIDNNIDQSLKIQMDSITKLRATISNKNQQIHMLQQNSCTLGSIINKLKQQLQQQRNKKLTSNKIQQNQNKKYEQNIKCLEEKTSILLIENRKKEEFIRDYLSRNDIDREQVMRKFQELYDLKNWKILNDGLSGEIEKIEKLKEQNLVLMKQIGRVNIERGVRKQQFDCQQFSVVDLK